MSDRPEVEAHRFLDWARGQGAPLDGSDASVWFVQGILISMAGDADEEPGLRAVKSLAYAKYLADSLAGSCRDVRTVVARDGLVVRDVLAVRDGGPVQYPLSWVRGCLSDPDADNVVFKYAGALADFGERERAAVLHDQLREYAEG
jgi:hypothetical protein